MTITQLLQMPEGTKTGGFDLVVKRARKTKRIDDKTRLMEILWTDTSAEMAGEIRLEGCHNSHYITPQTGHKIHIIVCWLQNGEVGQRLYVDEWKTNTMTPDEFEEMRVREQQEFSQNEEVIPSMCRNSQAREFIGGFAGKNGCLPHCTEENKAIINEWVEYILTGK